MHTSKKILNYIVVSLFVILTISVFSSSVNANPPEYLDDTYTYGPITGIIENEIGNTEWIMGGKWRSSLTNDTDAKSESLDAFNAAIEMIKPDGTARHTHAITDFSVQSISYPDNNSTLYIGNSTVSLQVGPAVDIPTTLQKSNDNNIFIIRIDPESVDYHFGDSPIYGLKLDRQSALQ